jgi:hypothetical protein
VSTQAELAQHLFLSTRALAELQAKGIVPRSPCPFDVAREAYIKHLRGKKAGWDSDLTEQRARLAEAQTEAQELKNAELRGDLVPRADHESVVIGLASAVVLRIDAMPSKAAPEVRATGSDAEGEAVLRRYVDEARTELADVGRDLLQRSKVASSGRRVSRARAGGLQTTSETHGEPVGGRRAKALPGVECGARTVEDEPG